MLTLRSQRSRHHGRSQIQNSHGLAAQHDLPMLWAQPRQISSCRKSLLLQASSKSKSRQKLSTAARAGGPLSMRKIQQMTVPVSTRKQTLLPSPVSRSFLKKGEMGERVQPFSSFSSSFRLPPDNARSRRLQARSASGPAEPMWAQQRQRQAGLPPPLRLRAPDAHDHVGQCAMVSMKWLPHESYQGGHPWKMRMR